MQEVVIIDYGLCNLDSIARVQQSASAANSSLPRTEIRPDSNNRNAHQTHLDKKGSDPFLVVY